MMLYLLRFYSLLIYQTWFPQASTVLKSRLIHNRSGIINNKDIRAIVGADFEDFDSSHLYEGMKAFNHGWLKCMEMWRNK